MRKVALAAVALAACGPRVIWTGHTADRRHTVAIAHDGDRQWVYVDGQRRGAYRSIAAWSIASDGDRFAYAAVRGGRWVVVDGGAPSGTWDGIGELVVRGRHTAYSAERAGGWYVVVDGVIGPRWDAILAGTLRFAGDHHAYVARDRAGVHVVVDGVVGPAWDGVGQLALSADGAHVAHAARRGDRAVAVLDGVAGPPADAIAQLTLDGATLTYAAQDGATWRVAGGADARYHAVRSLAIRDGQVAYLARDDRGDVVGCGGVERARAPHIDDLAVLDGCAIAYVAGGQVVHGDATATHDEVGALVAAPRGPRLAYAARTGARWDVIVDGVARRGGTYVSDPVWSPDGARVGFLARRGSAMAVIVDDHTFAFDLVLEDTLVFSRDARRWAVVAGELARRELFFVVDGARRAPIAPRELSSAAAQLDLGSPAALGADHGAVLRRWTQAEAEKE